MKDKNAQELGKKGGEATKNRYGKDYYKELQKKSVAAKLTKKKQG